MPSHDDELSRPILQDEDGNGGRSDSENELEEQLVGCGASACCNPSSTCHRFMALILMCLVGFGKFFVQTISSFSCLIADETKLNDYELH